MEEAKSFPEKSLPVEAVYPITTISYPASGVVEMITLEHIKEYTPPAKLRSLTDFMSGQGAPLGGYFPWDVQRWLDNEHRKLITAMKKAQKQNKDNEPRYNASVRP